MKTIIAAAAFAALALATAQPAHAWLGYNGETPNGIHVNGSYTNGSYTNGEMPNALSDNGVQFQGASGTDAANELRGFEIQAVALPRRMDGPEGTGSTNGASLTGDDLPVVSGIIINQMP